MEELLQGGGHLGGLGADSDQGAGVGGDGLVDGQDVGVVPGEAAQDGGQHAGLIVEGQMEGDDPADHHVMEGQNGIPVLVECAAADAGAAGGLVDGGDLTGIQEALCLCNLQEHIRQSGCFDDVIFGITGHSWKSSSSI